MTPQSGTAILNPAETDTAANIQTLMLVAVARHILKEGQKGTLTPKVAAKVALGLLRNAAVHQSKERAIQRCDTVSRRR